MTHTRMVAEGGALCEFLAPRIFFFFARMHERRFTRGTARSRAWNVLSRAYAFFPLKCLLESVFKGNWKEKNLRESTHWRVRTIFVDLVVLSRTDWELFSFIARDYIFQQKKNMADATRVKPIFNTSTPLILLLIQVPCRRHIYLYSLNGHSFWSKSQKLLGLHANCDELNY